MISRKAWVAIFLALPLGCKAKAPPPLRVAAAADLAHAFEEIQTAFAPQTPSRLTLTVGASGLLAKQISGGAPFDLFLAANSGYVEQVVRASACDGSTVHVYARGRLVIWSKRPEASTLTLARLVEPRFEHIAIANPEHAPYGAAAREALNHARVWNQVASRMVYGENVQQALELAKTGNADVAIVGLSLALAQQSGSWAPVDEALYAPIDQSLVVCRHGENPGDARRLADFLSSPNGRTILRKYGFLLPGEAVAKAP
jgi:molybdate transport system substrate-binding protein